jgi:tetraacyldisaccharide 4'-kinase
MKTSAFYFTLGRPFSPIYSLAMRLREKLYRRGMLQSYRLEVPVISVGNLTMGGTGKTPMVQYLARLLQSNGFHPAIVSRGYGGTASAKVNLVSDGSTLLLDAEIAGDEPRLLAETLPGVPVLTGIVRRLPAQRAVEMGADVLLLDDGFQHLQVIRDINLVLFSTDRLAGNSRVFPGGDLREPVTALHRASYFVMTGVRDGNREQAIRFGELLHTKFSRIPIAHTGYRVESLVTLSPAGMIEVVTGDLLGQEKCFGFCGIAHPESFWQVVKGCRIELVDFLPLDDHQRYSKALLDKLIAKAQQSGAMCLVTTEKDLVKLANLASGITMPLYGLRMQVEADDRFVQAILGGIRSWYKQA